MQVETKAELAKEEQEAKSKFKLLSQQLFRDEREECWVRPLAVALGYVPNMQFDRLHNAPQELSESGYKDDDQYELAREAAERPGRTVYSSLFVEAAEFSTARWGFFNNNKHNPLSDTREVVVSTLRSFQLQFERQKEETAAELFRDLADVVAVLYRSFVAQTEIHNDWSEETDGPVWLSSVQHEGYFSARMR